MNNQTKSIHWASLFLIFFRLGLTAFGGPIAHLAYFRQEFVARRQWLSEHAYAELAAFCQFTPGPASSKVGMLLGLSRGGFAGALAAWLGFTLPSAVALVWFGLEVTAAKLGGNQWHGLQIVAVAVVAQALWSMGKTLTPDKSRASIAVLACAWVSAMPSTAGQIGAIALGGLAGAIGLRAYGTLPSSEDFPVHYRKRWGIFLLSLFAGLLLGLPILNTTMHNDGIELFDRFYRVGALVFGGGHVVLPLLQAQVVPSGWVSNSRFLAGYGATQAVPGPLFTFAAYLGAVSTHAPGGWIGATIALVAVFLPSFLLVTGILPFWAQLRRHPHMQGVMKGINAAVVGLLLAAFYQPVWHSAVLNAKDFSWVLGVFALLVFWKTPPWLAVMLAVLAGTLGWV